MKIPQLKIVQSMVSFFVLISLFSCSKDTDLLADYVVSDLQEARFISNLAISDNFVIAPKKSIILDVLVNDTFADTNDVEIVKTTQPENGTVVINEDKTLTYYPNASDAPDTETNTDSNIDNYEEQNENSSQNIESTEEAPPAEETAQEEETIEGQPMAENTEETEEVTPTEETAQEEETKTETFSYSVETTDEEGNKTTQEAIVTVTTDLGTLKAFPSAEGFGKNTIGGRGGIVYHVTNLSNGGPGSLRYGLQKIKGPRTIVFDVSGYIDNTGDCSIRNPYVTIAGETAPEGGITLKGGALIIRTSEVIVRHLAVRPGVASGDDADCVRIIAQSENLHIDNVILDHLSVSWSRDENLSIGAGAKTSSISNVTIQNCLIAEALEYYGILIGSRTSKLSILRNLWANVPNRIPETGHGDRGESFEFINNIIYNYNRPTTIVYGTEADIIGNAYKMGPQRPAQTNLRYQSGPHSPPDSEGKIHASDNIQIGPVNPLGFKNKKWKDWERVTNVQKSSMYTALPSSSLEKTLLPDVGSILFDDPVDARILSEYRSGTGISGPVSENVVGGYPTIKSISRPPNYDTDNDGMADKWEIANDLDPTNPNDGKEDANGDGYTNLESFLYSLTRS